MANCVPVGPISYTVLTAPSAGAATGSVVIATSLGRAPAGISTASLPSEDDSAPPEVPTTFMVGAPPGALPGPPPPPQPTASVNANKIDVER